MNDVMRMCVHEWNRQSVKIWFEAMWIKICENNMRSQTHKDMKFEWINSMAWKIKFISSKITLPHAYTHSLGVKCQKVERNTKINFSCQIDGCWTFSREI
jgi:hypothetical protein